jgi:translation initiation factor 2 subunit 3
MFYYKKLVPEIDDIVVCKINKISDIGIYVNLLEYNDIEGYVPLKELTTHKYRKLSGIVKENDIEYIKVINIDKNYIDLSRKYIDEDEKTKVLNRYILLKRIYKIIEYSKLDNEIIKEYTEKVKNLSENLITKEILLELKFDENIINKIFPDEIPKVYKYNLNVLKFIKDFVYINSVISLFKTIEKECNVKINICNIKNGEILIISNEKIKEKELENLKNNVNLHLQSYTEESNKEENIEITLNESVGIQPTINIGIIGAVAAGKTTCIEALSGIDTRKYKKEIESNRTLKLGYTNISVTKCICENQYLIKKGDHCTKDCNERIFSIVDTPGHQALLSTMLCGASIMDTTMLIIAANETCPQLQTKEHLIAMEIANDNFEGNHNIIIQNKIDIINKQAALNSYNEINKFIEGTSIEKSQIYPISAKKKINTQSILKHIYNLEFDKTELNNLPLKAIVVRNFDINKPGNNELKGLVLGCSILSGKIKIGDIVLIMPQCIKIQILNIKTSNDNLNEAVSGGLIALETDANSFLINNNLIGSTIISHKDFNEKNFYKNGSEIMIKCYPLKKSSFKKDDTITLNILSREIPNCVILDVYKTSKYKYKIKLSTDIYIPNDTNIKISILHNKRLYGYGKFSEIKFKENNYKITTNQLHNSIDIRNTLYNNMLNESYQILKDNKVKLSLPKISIEYKNTFTQIFNFNTISDSINVSQLDLGNYIKTELGMRDFSIKTNTLSLKGRTNINNIQTIIIKYIKEEKLCPCCGSINTEHVKIMNVKKLKCLDC